MVILQLLNGLSLLLLQALYGLVAFPFKLHLLFLDLGIMAGLLLPQASVIFVLQTSDLLLMRLLQLGYLLLVFLAQLIGRGRQTGLFPLEAVLQLLDLLLEISDLPLHLLLQEVTIVRRIPLQLIHHPLVLLALLFELLVPLLLQPGLHVLEVCLELLCPGLQLETESLQLLPKLPLARFETLVSQLELMSKVVELFLKLCHLLFEVLDLLKQVGLLVLELLDSLCQVIILLLFVLEFLLPVLYLFFEGLLSLVCRALEVFSLTLEGLLELTDSRF